MLNRYRSMIESALSDYVNVPGLAPLLTESMAYGVLDGGKRIRPCILLCVTEMLGGKAETALPFAAALEMIHCYSLIHDDLPAMDDDDFRRGKPSNHKKYGEGNAILAGDGLLTKAALLLARQDGFDAAKRIILSSALEMVSGQSYDLNDAPRTEEMLVTLHRQKTGALFAAATGAGAVLAGQEALLPEFTALGETIGLLFQMTDDLLDAEKDAAEHKFTYLTFYGKEQTVRFIAEAAEKAQAILAPYDNTPAREMKRLVAGLTDRTE